MNNKKNTFYDDIYFRSQLRKFLYRRGGHWAERIEKVFDMVSKLDLLGDRVLDLGTSIGTYAFEFASRGYKTTGIDLSEDAINIARQIAKLYNKDITYIVRDVSERSNFKSEEFDIIYAGDIIEHLLNDILLKTIENCYFWLKPGGFFVFHTVPTKYNIIFHKSPFWILLIPFSVLPDKFFKKAVEMLFTLFNLSLKVLTGKSYIERERQTVHCNLQTKEKVSDILRKSGFEILYIELTTEIRFLRGLKKYFFKNKEYYQKDMFGVAWKTF
jgi:SAM-dependent methyltransferase